MGRAATKFRHPMKPLPPVDALLTRLPKAELHVHLDGCLRPATLLDLAREQHLNLPAATPAALAEYMLVRDAHSLEEYLERYQITVAVMQTEAALERIAYEFVLDVARENVRYVEVRYCPALSTPALTLSEAIEAPIRGLRRGEAETGTVARLIICGLRTLAPSVSMDLARAAVDYRKDGVVAFDLAGAERGHPAHEHRAAFDYAGGHGLRLTCHAGEGAGAESIRDAIESCGAERIGHGVRLREDPALVDLVGERDIALEMCLTSNVHTQTVPDVTTHPLREYFDLGLPVTVNTDGRLMDGVTLSHEFGVAHRALGFTRGEIDRLILTACTHAFLPEAEREALTSRVRAELLEIA